MPRLGTLAVSLAATALACGGVALVGATTASAAHHLPSAASAKRATVSTGHTKLGTFIAGRNGITLYLFEKDKDHHASKSRCYGECATAWPPLLTNGAPIAVGKARRTLLGTTKRKNGDVQVTYNGHPMYYFAGDSKAGQTRGEGSKEFGAEWDVVNPKGKEIGDGS